VIPAACPRTSTSARSSSAAALAAVLACVLGACSGGGDGDGGVSTSLDISPSSFTFEAETEGPLPAAQVLVATYRGDGVVIGYPPGVPEPSWLSMGYPGPESPQRFLLTVTSTLLPAAEYQTTVRVVTGKADGTQLVIRDVQVRYTLRQGPDRTVTPNAASVAFQSSEGLAPPPQTIQLSSPAAGPLTVAIEPRSWPSPDWLQVPPSVDMPAGGGPVDLTLSASGQPEGSYAADVVIRDARGTARARIPVTYAVARAYATSTAWLSASVTHAASLAELTQTLRISTGVDAAQGARYRWAIGADQPWVRCSPAEGDLSASVDVAISLDPDALWALADGSHGANLTLAFTEGGARGAQVPLSLELHLAGAALAVAPTLDLAAGRTSGPGDLARTLTVGSNLGEAFRAKGSWTAATAAPWLSVTASGPADGALVAAPRIDALGALPNGTHAATVTLVPASPRVQGASLEARLALSLPAVAGVAPYDSYAGRPEEVGVWGSGFGAPGPVPVAFGATTVEGRVVSDREIRVTPPAGAVATAGAVRVSVENTLQIDRGAATLKVFEVPAYPAARVPLGKGYYDLVLDPERRAVLLTSGWYGTDLRRLRTDGTDWTADAYALDNLTGVQTTVDGAALLVSSGTVNTPDLLLELDPETLALRRSATLSDHYDRYDVIAPFADGRTLFVNSEQWPGSIWYPGLAEGPRSFAWNPFGLLTRDRSRLLLVGRQLDVDSFDAGEPGFTARAIAATTSEEPLWSVSGDGGRLLAGRAVYDGAFAFLGQLSIPEAELVALALSPEGRWAYSVGRDGAGQPWVFRRTDVSGAAPFQAEATPLALSAPADDRIHLLRVSDDGGTLFALALAPSGTETVFHALPLP
jgi:hypothetical protein